MSSLPHTTLPPLHTSRSVPDDDHERRSAHREIAFSSATDALRDHLVTAFARFIGRLLGAAEEEYCFLLEDSHTRTAQLYSQTHGIEEISITSTDDVPSDFVLIVEHDEWARTSHGNKFVAHVSTKERQLHLTLEAGATRVPLPALQHLIDLFSEDICGSGHASQLSILNNPPRARPVSFPQEPEIDQHAALLHGCFERRVAQFPDRVALDFLTEDYARVQYTYREVNRAADRIAADLNARSRHGRSPVAIVMGPSPEMYVAYLAALKSGRPFCPVPTDAPTDRQRTILEDLECGTILTRTHDRDLPLFTTLENTPLPAEVPVMNISDVFPSLIPSLDTVSWQSGPPAGPCEDDLAYIMYTSGTTGKPKGVQISHLSAACSIAAHCAVAPLSTERPSRWFQFAAPTFDPSIMEIFVTWSCGGTLCGAERLLTLDNINAVVSQMDVDVMMATPSLASLLEPQHLKSLWTMGEALNTRVMTSFSALNPDPSAEWSVSDGPRGLYNAYGPTEAAINCTLLAHVPDSNRGSIIGQALPSCALIIVDEHDPLRPVPWGCAGELLIAGPQVSSRGYLNRPAETANAFLAKTPWGRVYRTGDRARIVWNSASGEPSVEFLGRISSDQVKLSGRRVELGEIDAVITSIPDVREALTVVYSPHEDGSKGSELPVTAVALVNRQADWTVVQKTIQAVVKKELPLYMRPYQIFLLSDLPRSAAGKWDRKTLSLLLHDKIRPTNSINGDEAPLHVTPAENQLLDILADIVQTRLSPTANLVASVGLDSLRAMQLLSRLRAQSIMEGLTLAKLLSGASVRQLLQEHERKIEQVDDTSRLLEEFSARHIQSVTQLAGINPADIERVVPATATQSGMIASFIRSSHGTHKTYINHSCYHLNYGALDLDRLVDAIEDALLAREAYRTTFVPVFDALAPFAQCTITRKAALDDQRWCRVARRMGTESEQHWLREAENEINLEQNVLYRFQIIDERLLVISLFHGIFDGASLELLMVEIERRYRGLSPHSCTDISLAAELDFSSRSQQTDDFWLHETAGYQAEDIPMLSGNKTPQTSAPNNVDSAVVHLTTSLKYTDLQARSRQIQASPLSIWQTAWALLLSSYSESQSGDVMFGSVVSNRFQPDVAVCHGPTFSMLPCRVRLPERSGTSVTSGQLAHQLAQNSARALTHAHPSMGLIATAEGKLPLDSLLALQHFEVTKDTDAPDDLIWTHITWPAMRNDFAIMLEIWPSDPHLPRSLWTPDHAMVIKLTFRTSLLTERVANRLLEQLSNIATSILDSPDQSLDVITGSMPMSLLSAQNIHPARLENSLMFLHSRFEEEAEQNPGKVALIFKHSLAESALEYTYAELNALADTFARRLQRHFGHIAPVDKIIPICLEKSPEMYIAILGILKAGAAWCPIDTTFPPQRRLELVRRTGSSLLVGAKLTEHLLRESLPVETTSILVDVVSPGTEPLDVLHPVNLTPGNLAYLIWTSGTTGAPKGVMIEHTAAVHAMHALQQDIPTSVDPSTGRLCPPRVLNFCSYSFDVFIQDLFWTFQLGGTLISSTREIMLGSFVQLAIESQATHAHLTPSFAATIRRQDLGRTLQVVTMIGEKLTERVADDWSWNTKAFNTYGPAECTIVSTLRQFGNAGEDAAKAANVGWSLSSVSSWVVQSEPPHRLVPFYGVGELALGGHQLARGYLNDAAKTEARFIWSEELQQRLYLTGDTVRMVDHGVEFLGRNDDLVKLNGIRVELSEISATCANAHEKVEHIETLMLSRPDRLAKAVVSFASLRGNAADAPLVATDKDALSVREQILVVAHQQLPEYMIPSFLILLNTMPRTASNKVDRKVLQSVYESADLDIFDTQRQLISDGQSNTTKAARSRTPVEEKVVAMLAELAGVDITGISEGMSLARLGIHSIVAIRLAWRLRKEEGLDVAVIDVLMCRNVESLLAMISSGLVKDVRHEEKRATREWLDEVEQQLFGKFAVHLHTRPPLVSAPDVVAIRPATMMQESLVIESLRNSRSYWSHQMFRLSGVDLNRLRDAWQSVAQATEMLRTSFFIPAEVDEGAIAWCRSLGIQGAILQAVTGLANICWSEIEWDGAIEPLSVVADRAAQKARLEASPIASRHLCPPWSITVLTNVENHEVTMMLHIHHALHDASSMQQVLDDVSLRYYQRPYRTRTQFSEALRLGLFPTKEQSESAQADAQSLLGGLVEQLGTVTTTKWPDMTGSRQQQERQILRTSTNIGLQEQTALWERLQAASSEYNLGSSVPIIEAAFGSILAEYLESQYVVLGETLDQRIYDSKFETVIGPLIQTVPRAIRIDLSSHELFTEISSRNATATKAMNHTPPASLRKILGVTSDQALYPALVVFHPAAGNSGGEQDHKDAKMFCDELEDTVGLSVEHALALNIFEADMSKGFRFELSGDSQVMSTQQLELLLEQLLHQLETMLSLPHVPLCEINNSLPTSLLSIAEGSGVSMRDLKAAVNDSGWAGIPNPSINPVAWVEYHARHHPQWIAAEEIVELDEPELTRRWTYAELLANTSRMLGSLQGRGIPKGSVVSIHLDRTLESFAAILAVFRGGYIYLPLDEELPPERARMLTVDSGARAIITTEEMLDELRLDESADWLENVTLLLVDDVLPKAQKIAESTVLPHYGSDVLSTNDGYILFTSGSTGKPKGVRVSNIQLCNFIECFGRRILDNSPETASVGGVGKYLNLASRAFDPHLTHMFAAWRLGMAATIGPRMMMLGNLESVIVQNGVTHFGTVPSVLQQARLSPAKVPSVVFVSVGGEKASNDVLAAWTDGDGRKPLMMNVYGPTEVTIGCVSNVVDTQSNARNIGKIFDSATAIVLAKQSNGSNGKQVIAKRGQTGELCIAGDLVSLGYMARPEAQAKAFATIDLPVTGSRSDRKLRIYKTGDLVRMMADGSIEYLGRSDQQAKVNGQRLELGEVEQFLRKTAKDLDLPVEFAAAVIQHPALPRPRLFAFTANVRNDQSDVSNGPLEILAADGDGLSQLTSACSKSLPAFMVPDLLCINRIPHLKASDKVDTKQLRELVESLPLSVLYQEGLEANGEEQTVTRTLTDDEQTVVKAIEAILETSVQNPQAGTSIYELGVDSLSAVQLSAHLKRLGFRISAADVLSHATIQNLAQRRGTEKAQEDPSAILEAAKERIALFQSTHMDELIAKMSSHGGSVKQVLPLLPLQAALYSRSMAHILEEEQDTSTHVPYVTQLRYSLPKLADLSRFTAAVEEVLQEEQMLRTCFCETNTGEIAQVVLSKTKDIVIVHSVTEQKSVSPREIARELIEKIGRIPPVRVHIIQGNSVEMLLSMHHSVFDGDAIKQVRQRIEAHYAGHALPRTSTDSMAQLLVHLGAVNMQAAEASWREVLAGATPCLVSESAPDEVTTGSRATHRLAAPLRDLQLAAQSNNLSLNALFQTAFALLLSELLPERSEVIFGSVLSLRPLLASAVPDIDRLVAPCLNTIPQRVQLSLTAKNDGTLRDLGHGVRDSLGRAVQHAFLPLDRIMKCTQADQALFDAVISVNMHSQSANSVSTPAQILELVDTLSAVNTPLAADVNVYNDGENGHVEVEISSNIILTGGSDVSKLAERFAELCSMIVERPQSRLSDLLPRLPAAQLKTAIAQDSVNEVEDGSPWSKSETLLRDLLQKLLKIPSDTLGKQTSFYRLGLDSISVLRLVRLLRDRIGAKLSPIAVLRARCIAAVAQLIDNAPVSRSTRSGLHRAAHGRILSSLAVDATLDSSYIATPMQQGMLSAGLSSASAGERVTVPYVYRHSFQIRDRASFDVEMFENAWGETVQQIEILRTTFHFTGDSQYPWIGVVHSQGPRSGPEHIIGSLQEAANLPVNVDVGSALVKYVLVVPSEATEPITVIFIMHHASYDGGSLPLLWQVLRQNYGARKSGMTVSNSQLVPFSDFARHVSLSWSEAVQYWNKQLQGYSYSPLTLKPRGPSNEASNPRSRSRHHTILPIAQYNELKRACQDLGVTVQAALLLGWSKILALSVLQQSDVVLGQVLSGRSLSLDEEKHTADTVVGPTLNTVALRVSLESGLTNREALQKTQWLSEEALQHQVASLRMVQNEWRALPSSGSATDLFESLFVFNGGGSDSSEGSQSDLWQPYTHKAADEQDGFAEYPLVCSLHVSTAGLHVQISSSADKFDASDAERLSLSFQAALQEQMVHLDAASVPSTLPTQLATSHRSDGVSDGREELTGQMISDEDRGSITTVIDVVQALLRDSRGQHTGKIVTEHTNLFRLGLDSILAIRLASKLKRTEVPLTVNHIMQGKTVAAMVARSRQDLQRKSKKIAQNSEEQTADEIAITKADEAVAIGKLGWRPEQVQSVLPCLAGQEHHLESWVFAGYRFFQAPWTFKLKVKLNVSDVIAAWDELRKRHAILRTTFVALPSGNGNKTGTRAIQVTQTAQHVDGLSDGTFTYVRDSGTSSLDVLVVQHLADTNSKPANLRTPPVQLALLQTSSGECAIIMRIHHAMYDAWSIRMLLSDLDNLLAGLQLAPQAMDLAQTIQTVVAQRNTHEEKVFWAQALRHAQPTILGPRAACAEISSPLGPQRLVRLQSVVPAATVRTLESLAQTKANSSLSPAIMLAFAKTLAQECNAGSSPTFGFYHASRTLDSVDLTQSTLPTMTLTPFTIDVSGLSGANVSNDNVAIATVERLQAVQSFLGQLTQFGQASLHDILESAGAAEHPLFNCYINLLYRDSGSPETEKTALERMRPSVNTYFTDTEASDQDVPSLQGLRTEHISPLRMFVDVVIDRSGDGISLGLRCDSVYDIAHVEEFAARFVSCLERVEQVLSKAI